MRVTRIFKIGDIVRVRNSSRVLKIIKFDNFATKKLGKNHWMCKILHKSCIDSYAEYKLEKLK